MNALHDRLSQARPYLFLWSYEHKSGWSNKVRNNTISSYWYFVEFPEWRVDPIEKLP